MPPGHGKRAKGWDLLLASLLVTAGLVICGVSLIEISRANVHLAQATQPLQPSTPDASEANKPAESKPGGERPTTPAPEPARPGEQAQKDGAKPALPPAPAEKIAPPMQQK
jgi:outer membrane biosynthesis protein TonB